MRSVHGHHLIVDILIAGEIAAILAPLPPNPIARFDSGPVCKFVAFVSSNLEQPVNDSPHLVQHEVGIRMQVEILLHVVQHIGGDTRATIVFVPQIGNRFAVSVQLHFVGIKSVKRRRRIRRLEVALRRLVVFAVVLKRAVIVNVQILDKEAAFHAVLQQQRAFVRHIANGVDLHFLLWLAHKYEVLVRVVPFRTGYTLYSCVRPLRSHVARFARRQVANLVKETQVTVKVAVSLQAKQPALASGIDHQSAAVRAQVICVRLLARSM
mmetsp:Transcript_51788/g.82615  ORF Transcript_51788/g.82615 Transcript_51788/m.82615 type:complete len:267 (+) Transcript_51788:198-998(+)